MQEFDFLEETYTPILEQEKLLSSKGYQTLKKNNIDTAELDGIEKEPEAGTIEFKELSDEDNKIFLKDVTDFLFDIPRDTIISFIRGTTNASQFINNLTSAIGINPDDSYEFINKRLDETKAHLDSLQEDSPFVTKLMGMVAQDAAYTYPIYKKLQKLGVPKSWNVPISFGLGGALAFDKKETLTVDSTMVQGLKEMAGIDPDTPAGELYDKGFQAIEYAFGAKLADKIIQGFKLATKIKNKKQLASDVAIGTAGGAVLTKSIMDETEAKQTEELEKITTIDEDKIREEKKTLNFDDQSAIPGTVNEYGFEKTAGLLPIVKAAGKELAKNPIFKSNVVEAVNKIPNTGSGNQVLGQIKNIPGVKQSEIKWIGLDDFLQNKKSVTKQEVSDFVNSNRIDVSEVKFSGASVKPNKELQQLIDDYEVRWRDSNIADVARPDYDNFQVNFLSPKGKLDEGKMDFSSLATVIGDDVIETSFEKRPSGLLKYKNRADTPDDHDFLIHPLELERYKIERMIRQNPNMQVGKPKFERFTSPGGEDYTELVFSLRKGGMEKGIPIEARKTFDMPGFGGSSGPVTKLTKGTSPFKGGHFGVKSEIAHVRFKTRYGEGLDDGQKILTVEEMQSDFAIAAKRAKTESGDPVTDFPFKNTWYELTIKRLIRYAADNGFDAVAIPKGSVAAKRYGQEIDKVKTLTIQKNKLPTHHEVSGQKLKYEGNSKNEYVVRFIDEDGKDVMERVFFDNFLKNLEKIIGLKNFNELVNLEKTKKLKIGTGDVELPLDKPIILGSGKGKAQLYDQAIPSFLKKYGKKWNAKVYDDTITTDTSELSHFEKLSEMPVTIIKLTPEMKKAVQEGGQSLFEILGTLGASGVAAKALSDSQGNNTISN